jgi:hypothetical protein
MAAAMYASVIASASRAGTVLTTVEILAVSVLDGCPRIAQRDGPSAPRFSALSLLFAIFTTATVGWTHVWDRFRSARSHESVRREFAISSLRIIADHPYAGYRSGNLVRLSIRATPSSIPARSPIRRTTTGFSSPPKAAFRSAS